MNRTEPWRLHIIFGAIEAAKETLLRSNQRTKGLTVPEAFLAGSPFPSIQILTGRSMRRSRL